MMNARDDQRSATAAPVSSATPVATHPVLVVVHGLGEHSGRYRSVAERLSDLGWLTFAQDLPGHGSAAGRRGDVASYELLLDRIEGMWSEAARIGKPCRLWGHSFGGNLVVNLLLRRGRLTGLQKALVTGPMFRTTHPAPLWKRAAARTLAGVWPTLTVGTGIDPRDLSRDESEVDAYRTDAANHDRISARLGRAMIDSGKWALEHAAQWKTQTAACPLNLWHGERDAITSCEASRLFAANAGSDVHFEAWPEARHELHHDLCRDQFVRRLEAWLSNGDDAAAKN